MNSLFIAIGTGIAGALGFGVADFFSARAMSKEKLSEYQATFWLYAITTLVVWGFAFSNGSNAPVVNFDLFVKIFLASLINVVVYVLFFKALRIGSLSTISAIFSIYSAGAVIVSIFFYGEILSTSQILAIIILILGVIAVSISDTGKITTIKGFREVLIAVILFSFFFPYWDSIISQFNSGQEFYLAAIADSLITIMFFLLLIFFAKEKSGFIFNKGYLIIVLAGVFNALAVIFVTTGYSSTNFTSIVTVLSASIPIVSASLDYIINKNKLIWTQYLGIILLIIGTGLLII